MSRTNAANWGTRLPVGQVAELVYMDAVTHVVGTALRLYLFGDPRTAAQPSPNRAGGRSGPHL
jgi:hypothetical protein